MSAFQNVIPRCHRGCVVTVVCPPCFTDRAAAHYVVATSLGLCCWLVGGLCGRNLHADGWFPGTFLLVSATLPYHPGCVLCVLRLRPRRGWFFKTHPHFPSSLHDYNSYGKCWSWGDPHGESSGWVLILGIDKSRTILSWALLLGMLEKFPSLRLWVHWESMHKILWK